jgi:hypothetical protein
MHYSTIICIHAWIITTSKQVNKKSEHFRILRKCPNAVRHQFLCSVFSLLYCQLYVAVRVQCGGAIWQREREREPLRSCSPASIVNTQFTDRHVHCFSCPDTSNITAEKNDGTIPSETSSFHILFGSICLQPQYLSSGSTTISDRAIDQREEHFARLEH